MHRLPPLRFLLIPLTCLALIASPAFAVGHAGSPAETDLAPSILSWLDQLWQVVAEVLETSTTDIPVDTAPSDPPPQGQDAPGGQDELAGEVVPIG